MADDSIKPAPVTEKSTASDNVPDYEYSKLQADFIKHVNGLSTGAIVLVTVFLEKIFPQPRFRAYIAVALIAFLVSVISGIVAFGCKDLPRRGFRLIDSQVGWVVFVVDVMRISYWRNITDGFRFTESLF
jgi:hypothetical protein